MSDLPIDPITQPEVWDVVIFSGIAYGFCELSGFDREYEWDIKQGRGVQGATCTFVGQGLAKGSVKFFAWEKEHFDSFKTILKIITYDPRKKATAQAIQVWHPSLIEQNVNAVVPQKIGKWEHDGQGLYTRTVEFLEFKPPPKIDITTSPVTSLPNEVKELDPALKSAKSEFDQALKDAKALGAP